jgi:L-cysteine S-thiosulfotransferase
MLKKKIYMLVALLFSSVVWAGPSEDLASFKRYFQDRFPDVKLAEFKNGVYAVDAAARDQWDAIEEFPPYETNIEVGEELFNEPFKNGKSYVNCFPDADKGIKQNYPYFDDKIGEVVTLEKAINNCRKKNGEGSLKYKKGKIADLSAYIGYLSRGKLMDVKVSGDKATKAYEKGKNFFYAKRGQLNMSCADCHVYYSGKKIRADRLSPALGQATHFPVYRAKWGNLGTMHRRYAGCNKQVRALPFKAQSPQYRNLEYFHTYMSNGLDVNAPGYRK